MSLLWTRLLTVASLVLVVGLVLYSGQNPRVVVYSIFFESVFRLLTLELFIRVHEGRALPLLKPHLGRLTSTPLRGQLSLAWTDESSGKEVTLGGYLFWLILVSAAFGFPMLHVDRHGELDITFAVFAREFVWGLGLAMIYWVEDLVGRQIIVKFSLPRGENFGYNAFGFTAVVLAVLIGGTGIAFYPRSWGDPTPWLFCIPLLVFRHLLNSRRLASP